MLDRFDTNCVCFNFKTYTLLSYQKDLHRNIGSIDSGHGSIDSGIGSIDDVGIDNSAQEIKSGYGADYQLNNQYLSPNSPSQNEIDSIGYEWYATPTDDGITITEKTYALVFIY